MWDEGQLLGLSSRRLHMATGGPCADLLFGCLPGSSRGRSIYLGKKDNETVV